MTDASEVVPEIRAAAGARVDVVDVAAWTPAVDAGIGYQDTRVTTCVRITDAVPVESMTELAFATLVEVVGCLCMAVSAVRSASTGWRYALPASARPFPFPMADRAISTARPCVSFARVTVPASARWCHNTSLADRYNTGAIVGV